uniref:Reverse transcriptase domain-containing protein n=1 Tax=Phytophthora ramorum TaxID=164328 RepID=H3H050_PHYRM
MASLLPASLKKEATEDEKEKLFKQLREARISKKARLKRLGEMLPDSERNVTLNGVLTLPYCPDSGLDCMMSGRSHWKLLRAADASVEAVQLDVPVRTQTFGATSVKAEFKTSLHVMIHTAARPVEPMSAVDVLIVDVDDDEFIVGNDLLTPLDIDINRQLEQLVDHGNDENSGDSIELEADEMSVNPTESVSSDDDIFAAVENRFPLDHVVKLRTIAHAYDVWRLELRDDLRANVPPLEEWYTRTLRVVGRVLSCPSVDLMYLCQTTDYRAVNDMTKVLAAVMPVLSLLDKHLLIWIDDLLLYAVDMETYLVKLAEFFGLLNQVGLKFSVKKSSLSQTEVKWCGKIINHEGWTMHGT